MTEIARMDPAFRKAVEAAIAAHQKVAELGEGDERIQAWQLLVSLVEWHRDEGVDFDEALREAREHLASD